MKTPAKYWLPFALVVVPSVLIGAWAFRQFAVSFQRQEEETRSQFQRLCWDTAEGVIQEKVRELQNTLVVSILGNDEALLAAFRAKSFVQAAFFVGQNGHVVKESPNPATNAVNPTNRIVAELPAELLEARRLEFVENDPARALAGYEKLTGHAADNVRAEAWQGVLGCLVKQEKFADAAARLSSAVATQTLPFSSEYRLSIAREIAAGLEKHGDKARAAALLLDTLEGLPTVSAGFQDSLDRLCGNLSELDRRRYDRWTARQRAEAQRAELETALGTGEHAWIAALIKSHRSGLTFWDKPVDHHVDAGMPIQGDDTALIFRLNDDALASAIHQRLASQTGLKEMAAGFSARYGKPITDAKESLRVPTPWNRDLVVAPPAWPVQGQTTKVHPLVLAGLCLLAGVLTIIAGVVALVKATQKDLALLQLKSDFVSNVSHELKTPLSLVRMFGEMLNLGYAKNETERKEYYGVICKESERLTILINNILDFARIEKGEKTYAAEPVRLDDVVQDVVNTYRKQLDAAGFVCTTDIRAPIPAITGDKMALTQAFLNLLSNAMKYSDTQKRIAVILEQTGDSLVLSVRDQGIGIPRAEQEKIFEKFYRVETGLTRTTRGSGLGLTLVRHIVEGHGGRVVVESEEGHGSTFRVVLPLNKEKQS